ncbi:MAG: SDR family oxidoreductase, partial [Planctomycetota bacterium]|nr:SDR family oxidoreductase [Planctomycetota bacterium]
MPSKLTDRTGVIFGVANKRSLAWSCAKALDAQGMRLCLTYATDRLGDGVRKLAEELNNPLVLRCDVTDPDEIDSVFVKIGDEFGHLDTVLHGVAFAKREELVGNFYHTTKDGYMLAHEVSAYSLTA